MLSFLSAVASIVSLVITIFQWNNVGSLPARLLFVVCVLSTAALSYYLQAYRNLKYDKIFRIVHLKGLCAVSHELYDFVCSLSDDDLAKSYNQKFLKRLSSSAGRRARDLSSGNERLLSIAQSFEKLAPSGKSVTELRSEIDSLFNKVDDVLANYLKSAGLHTTVYATPPMGETGVRC